MGHRQRLPALTPALTLTPGGILAITAKVLDRGHIGLSVHTPFAERFPERQMT